MNQNQYLSRMKEKDTIDLILLNMGYAIHAGNWNYQNVNSPFARIFLVMEGSARLHFQDHTQTLTPRNLYIIPPFTQHSYECYSHFSLYYIHIYETPSLNYRMLEDFLFPTEIETDELAVLLVMQLLKINPGRDLKVYDPLAYDNSRTLMKSINMDVKTSIDVTIETQGILFQLLARFLKNATHKYGTTDDRIRMTLRYIRKNIHESIKMEDLIQISFLSKDHLTRLFKKEMHLTPVQYINQKKIEQAQLLLISTDSPIKDIAYALSFDNISYFNRMFKRYVGVTPLNYRLIT